ncbi:hypothetical protein [Embleya sp. NPDC059237]|uniref:hypothetical protein n=1 Tax=Embleya sp. NPDC059237 TaxID=3346784 RepID=UPI00368FA9DB
MNDDQSTNDPTTARRGRLVRIARSLAASTAHALATDAGTPDHPTASSTMTARARLARAGRVLTATAARGLATGVGTAAGTWIVWWITHR